MTATDKCGGGESARPGNRTGGPRAVPEPSKASKDRPTPRPIRPQPPRANAEPPIRPDSTGTRQEPADRPPEGAAGRETAPSQGGRAGDSGAERRFDAKGLSSLAGKTTGIQPPGDPKATRPTLASITRATPRPGVTQALRVGPGESGTGARFTTHTLRGQERVNVKQEVDVSYRLFVPLRPDTPATVQRGRLVDISLGGAQIEGPPLPEAEGRGGKFMIRAQFELPFVEKPLVADAHVAWTKPSGEGRVFMGLRFDALSDEQSGLIKGYLIAAQSPTRVKFRRGK